MNAMWLIVAYALIIVLGAAIAVAIGLALDRTHPPLSVPVFIFLYFSVFFFGWKLAVRLTEPTHAKRQELH
jgi:hypothetical protein